MCDPPAFETKQELQKMKKINTPEFFFHKNVVYKSRFQKRVLEISHFFGCDENRHKLKKTSLKMRL
jgi:hypothetical protein